MAVYTEVSDEDIATFLGHYDVGTLVSMKGIAEGVQNSNYLLGTEKEDGSAQQFILTLYEAGTNSQELPFFLSLMDHLAAKKLPCPVPIKDKNGNALQNLNGRPAAMVSFLQGVSVRTPQPHHCEELGAALADLHLAAADFSMTRTNDLSLDGWIDLADDQLPRADRVRPDLPDIIRDELAHLKAAWPTLNALPRGIVHADLFPDNVFFKGQNLSGLIDFYFAATDILVYDIGVCLNAWCFEADGSFNVTKAGRLLAGYLSHRTLSDAELAALPLLARGAAMRFLLTRLHDWFATHDGALVRKKDPLEYLRKLRFHQAVTGPADYGL